jgi:hypothetical protein
MAERTRTSRECRWNTSMRCWGRQERRRIARVDEIEKQSGATGIVEIHLSSIWQFNANSSSVSPSSSLRSKRAGVLGRRCPRGLLTSHEIERCRREIAAIKELIRAGHPDLEGLCLALSDWCGELRLLGRWP